MSDEFKSIAQIEKNERMRARRSKKNSPSDMKEFFKNMLIMVAITLVAGGVLGFVYELTKEPIALMEEKEKADANRQVFMLADSFSLSCLDRYPIPAEIAVDYEGIDITDVIEAYDSDGILLGYVIEVNSHLGFGGDIVFRMGIDTTGSINAVSIISILETAGLGMRASEVLTPQFKNRNELQFEVVKDGATQDNQIDAISSATITSNAITKGANAALYYYTNVLMGGELSES